MASQVENEASPDANSPKTAILSRERHQTGRNLQQTLPLIIQTLAKEAAETKSWPLVLKTAPSAIRSMATCLVASTNQKAGAIEIKIKGLDSHGKPIEQPYKYLSTNLQHCSDLGRVAFSDAQSAMNRLMNHGKEMTGPTGLIADILEIIEDPDEAKFSLRPAMENLEETAERCKDEAESIHDKFANLLDFIMALEKAAIEQAGHTSEKKGSNETKIAKGEENKSVNEKEIEKLTEAVTSKRAQKEKDEAELRSATATVNQLAGKSVLEYLPPGMQEPEPFEPPKFEAPVKDSGGLFGITRRFFSGESDDARAKYEKKYREAKEEHDKVVSQLQEQYNRKITEFMEQKKQHLDIARDDAERRLQTVKSVYEKSLETLATSKNQLDTLERENRKAQFELAATEQNLATLREEGMELTTILKIIRDSIKSLSYMKACIDDMKNLFTKILDDVKRSMSGPLDGFLEGINTAAVRSGNAKDAREINALEFTNLNKRRLTEQALRLYGKIYMISDVARIYVDVSTKYIKPAINRMEELATVDGSQYITKCSEFETWCNLSVKEIDRLAIREADTLAHSTATSVREVARHTLAIEAPDNNTGGSKA